MIDRHWFFTRISRVHWNKTRGGRWYDFWVDDLSAVGSTFGVYVIALELPGELYRLAIYMGEGNIRERLRSHRAKPEFKWFRGLGKLVFTWISVYPKRKARCIEAYLHAKCPPCLSSAGGIGHIQVNIPRYLQAWC